MAITASVAVRASPRLPDYAGAIQRAVTVALCRNQETLPIKLAVMPRAANDAPCPASMPLPVGHDADRQSVIRRSGYRFASRKRVTTGA
jgi:hypothetical protein